MIDLTPPASDVGVLYNVPRIRVSENDETGEPEYWQPDLSGDFEWRHVDSVRAPPEIDDDRIARNDAYEVFYQHLLDVGFPRHDALGNENYIPGWEHGESQAKWRGEVTGMFDALDRTLEFPLVQRLPDAVARLRVSKEPFVFVAAFDNWKGRQDMRAVWVAQRRGENSLRLTEPAYSGNTVLYVSADGRMACRAGWKDGDYLLRNSNGTWGLSIAGAEWGETFCDLESYPVPRGTTAQGRPRSGRTLGRDRSSAGTLKGFDNSGERGIPLEFSHFAAVQPLQGRDARAIA